MAVRNEVFDGMTVDTGADRPVLTVTVIPLAGIAGTRHHYRL